MARGVILIGDEKLLYNLYVHEKHMNHGVAKALQKAGGEVIRVSITKTPVKTGELRKRSFSEGPLKKGNTYVQVVGYENYKEGFPKLRKTHIGRKASRKIHKAIKGDEAKTLYANAVHEDLEAHHDVGEAKFLENAVNETSPKLGRYLQRELKKVYR